MEKGRFIVFEGVDGSGKTTQANKLYNFLKSKNFKTILTKEPGGTKEGEKIRKILLDKNFNIPPVGELLLYEADRNIHINNLLKPKLKEGYIIISDRYIYSTIAYQSYGRGIERKLIDFLNSLATEDLKPDIVFLLDIPVEEALKRYKGKDRIESESLDFHRRLREGFLKTAKENKDIFYIIDGLNSVDNIFNEIVKVLKEREIIR